MDLNNVALLANDGNVNRGGRGNGGSTRGTHRSCRGRGGNGLPYAMSKLKKKLIILLNNFFRS